MKMYVFILRQLSDMDKGIQACHAVCELINEFLHTDGIETIASNMILDWMENHKTLVYLNGGRLQDLENTRNWLLQNEYRIASSLPFRQFNEPDLGNVMTAVAVLVPKDLDCIDIEKWAFLDRLSTYEKA